MTRWLVRCCARAALIASLCAAAAARQHASGAHELVAACRTNNVTLTTRKLVELGPAAVDELTRELVLRAPSWSESQLTAVVHALRERLSDTRAALLSIARDNPSLAAHTRALELLAEIGAPRDLTTAVTIASGALAQPSVAAELDEAPSALRACAGALIAKHGSSSNEFPRALHVCPDELAPALIDALVDTGGMPALELLAELVRTDAWSETYLIGALSRVARKLDAPFDERVCSTVRDLLDGVDPARVREAAACSGWLEDAHAVDTLVELLSHSDRGVHESARWALQRITGRSFASNQRAWRRWIDQQCTWWNERAPELLVEIEGADAAARFRALNEVVRRRFPRHELARELARVLPSTDAAALHLGCATLANLRSKAALPALRELHERADGAAREAVGAALRALEPHPLPLGTPAD